MNKRYFSFITITKESIERESLRAAAGAKHKFYRHCSIAIVFCLLMIIYYPRVLQYSRFFSILSILVLLHYVYMVIMDLKDQHKAEKKIPEPKEVIDCICEDMSRNNSTAIGTANGVVILNRELMEEDFDMAAVFLNETVTKFGEHPTIQYIRTCISYPNTKKKGFLLANLLQYALENNQTNILSKGSDMAEYILIKEER